MRQEIISTLKEIRDKSISLAYYNDKLGRSIELRTKISNRKPFVLYLYSDTFDIYYPDSSNKLDIILENFNSY